MSDTIRDSIGPTATRVVGRHPQSLVDLLAESYGNGGTGAQAGPPLTEYPPRQLEGRMEEPKPDLVKELVPLLIAQGLDLGSTELILRSNPSFREGNPLPGANHTLGRLGWGLARDAAVAGTMMNLSPQVGKLIRNLTVLSHLFGASSNMKNYDDTITGRLER